ncbi:hypothetical protein QBC37DRAFT_408194 [Rhypophila decipiens]|uniref:Uncharacterized protein n=1 Tax=Rhypophila decipiens TaxID=261697 RepID=A0AAN7BDX3_9PEZI|nr:hypothetical protein QBC37DRAFT_408194 [Rhypophila decipiens]
MGLSPEAIIALVGVVLAVPSALFCCLGCLRHGETEELDEAEERSQPAPRATISCPASQICLSLHIERERHHFSEEFLHIHLGAEISSNSQIVPVLEQHPTPRHPEVLIT